MSRGVVLLAQNNNTDNYVLQASVLAMSLKVTNPTTKISIITNDTIDDEYKSLFDKVIQIPFGDSAVDSEWKVENRWKIYHATPYNETLVLDTDTLVLQDISSWWNFFENYELYFTSSVNCYRGKKISNDYYRKAFTYNNLPNLYSGCHYFKKSDFAHEFYKWMEVVVQNWELFYGIYVKEYYPGRPSIDITAALVAKILDCEDQITNKKSTIPNFVHMKSKVQDWKESKDSWQDTVNTYFNQTGKIKIGNYMQSGIFHYTEKDFLTDSIVNSYKEFLND